MENLEKTLKKLSLSLFKAKENLKERYNMNLMEIWRKKNDRGEGFAVGLPDHSPAEAAEWHDMTDIHTLKNGCVLATDRKTNQKLIICDSNGPWAVHFDEDGGNNETNTCNK